MLDHDQILSFRLDGRPIFGFSGAEGEGDGDGGGDGGNPGGDGSQPDPNAIGSDGLTAAGRAAIQAERNNTKTARTEARGWKAVGAEFGFTTPDQIREALSKAASPGTQAPVVDEAKIRQEAEAAATTKANRRVARAELTALATEQFASAKDVSLVFSDEDLDDLLNRNGELDANAAKSALAGVLTERPHWAKITQDAPPSYDGGPRSTGGGGPQTAGDFFRSQVRAKKGH